MQCQCGYPIPPQNKIIKSTCWTYGEIPNIEEYICPKCKTKYTLTGYKGKTEKVYVEKKLMKKIIKTKWEYGLNPESFYVFIYDDGSKSYIWDTPHYSRNFIDTEEYWFKFYWDFVRTPWIRTGKYAAPSDVCEIAIEIYNTKGKIIKEFNTRKY